MRWWQLRPIDFSLMLFALIVQRTLLALLYIIAATYSDFDEIPISLALDATYTGLHAPSALKQIVILGWVLLAMAALSAYFERCYKLPKAIFVFAGLTVLMGFLTLNALTIYEPYLAIRR